MEQQVLFKENRNCVPRKTLLYRSGVRKGVWALNHILGCAHGCRYPCYAFKMAVSFGRIKNYDEWIKPRVVCNALWLLKGELRKYHPDEVHMCLSTDPFMYDWKSGKLIKEIKDLTLSLIEELNSRGIRVVTLTKGFYPDELLDTSRFLHSNMFGISIVSLNSQFKEKYEPFSSPYELRINSLLKLHQAGYRTWVNMEPYPVPEIDPSAWNIENLLEKLKFVDKIRLSGWNYNSTVKKKGRKFYWKIAEKFRSFCEKNYLNCTTTL